MLSNNRFPIYASSLISGLGNWITSIVIFMWVYQVTEDPFLLGISIVCHRLPLTLGAMAFGRSAEEQPLKIHLRLDFLRFIILILMSVTVYVFDQSASTRADMNYVQIFLVLASLRSFLSGAEPSCKAKIVSLGFDEISRVGVQHTIQVIVGLTGILSSIFYLLSFEYFEFHEVLIFDACTFAVSYLLLRRIEFPEVEKLPTKGFLADILENKSIWNQNPAVWQYLALNSLRIGTNAGLSQLSLIVLQQKFYMGSQSTGYLYLLLTTAWFLSAKLVEKMRLQLPIWSYLTILIVICSSVPLIWNLTSLWAIGAMVFFLWFLDGLLLASFVGTLQLLAKPESTARLFGIFTIFSNIIFVIMSFAVGWLTKLYGFINGNVIFTIISITIALGTFVHLKKR